MERLLAWLNRRVTLSLWLCLLFSCLVLGVRVHWIASHNETGLTTLRLQWRDATVGWVLGEHQPISMQEPSEQAEYWLRETDRILKTHPNDARLAMGAALVLDSPGGQYKVKHCKFEKFGASTFPKFDNEFIKRAEAAFESRCQPRCLELAAQATKLDPANVDWWRLRAILMFHESKIRDVHWADILEECACHDPDNALYDYLAAYYYWEASGEWEYASTDYLFIVKDGDNCHKGIQCFERGQLKPFFCVGDTGYAAVNDFLGRSGLPIVERSTLIDARDIHARRLILTRDLWRLQGSRSREKAASGEVETAIALERQNLRLFDQIAAKEPSMAYDSPRFILQHQTVTEMKSIVEKHKEDFDPAEIKGIGESVIIEELVVKKAAALLPANKNPRVSMGGVSMTTVSTGELLSGFLVCFIPPFSVLLSLLGLLSSIFIRARSKTEVPTVGPVGHLAAMITAMVASFVVFGLCPAEIIDKRFQHWMFTIGLLSIPFAILLGIGWIWLKRRAFQYTIRTLLIGTLVFYLVFAFLAALKPLLTEFPFHLWIPARGWGGLDLAVVEPLKQAYGDWCWAILQWNAYGGGYVALAIWMALIAIVYAYKIRQRNCQPDAAPLTRRKELAGVFYSLGRPAFLVATLFLISYLVLVPGFLEQTEQAFQEKIAFARHPERHWAEVEKNIAKVRADEATMKIIESSAKEQPPTEENTSSERDRETPSGESNADR